MKALILAVIGFTLFSQARANQLYGWVGSGFGEGLNYFTLDSNSSSGGSIADVVSFTMNIRGTETTYTPSSAMTFFTPFTWDSTKITAMALLFSPDANTTLTPDQGKLDTYTPGQPNFTFYDPKGAWLAFDSLDSYTAAANEVTAPDGGETGLLLLIALAIFVAHRFLREGGWNKARPQVIEV